MNVKGRQQETFLMIKKMIILGTNCLMRTGFSIKELKICKIKPKYWSMPHAQTAKSFLSKVSVSLQPCEHCKSLLTRKNNRLKEAD